MVARLKCGKLVTNFSEAYELKFESEPHLISNILWESADIIIPLESAENDEYNGMFFISVGAVFLT